MELAGHKCVGFCEFDKYAYMSYVSMHLLTDEQREYLATLDLKQRQKEIMKDEYRNGEWYANDVRTVDARDIPRADCWCFGFPCQDISVARTGSYEGLHGNRSSLFFRIMHLIGELRSEAKPRLLFAENVKNLIRINGGWDFARLLLEMDTCGYDAEWQVLNSKDFGVAQSRERCFIVGHDRQQGTAKVFPVASNHGENPIPIKQVGSLVSKRKNPSQYRVYDPSGISPTLNTCNGGGRSPAIALDRSHETGTVRYLTPKEFFRLQGWTDDMFERAAFVNMDVQLYKQAGNGVSVPVIEAIARRLEWNESQEQKQSDSNV